MSNRLRMVKVDTRNKKGAGFIGLVWVDSKFIIMRASPYLKWAVGQHLNKIPGCKMQLIEEKEKEKQND